MQWHASRAVDLLKELQKADGDAFSAAMTDPLFADLDKAGKSVWSDIQAQQFAKLMESQTLQALMDELVVKDLTSYLEKVTSWGITNPQAQIAMARILNTGETFAKKVIEKLGEKKNDYQEIIAVYNQTEHGKKYHIFDHKVTGSTPSAQEMIAQYQAPQS